MTHDTPPKRIFIPKGAELGVLLVDTEGLIEEDAYILASETDAMVAAALREAAAKVQDEANAANRDAEDAHQRGFSESAFHIRQHAEAMASVIPAIEALIPQPASAALDKLIAEAEARGMERCAQIADDHTPGKHMGGTLAAHVTGRTIAAAIRAAKGDQT